MSLIVLRYMADEDLPEMCLENWCICFDTSFPIPELSIHPCMCVSTLCHCL